MRQLILLLTVTFSLLAAELDWHTSYEAALQEAKETKRPLLVFLSRPFCGSCTYMKEKVFTDERVIAYLNENYVYLIVDITEDTLPLELQMRVSPVFHFLNEDGEKITESLIGGKKSPFFLEILQKAKDLANQQKSG